MEDQVQLFNFEDQEVRTTLIDDEPYFVGSDVAKILGYSRPADAVRKHVSDKYKGVAKMETPGGKQDLTVISEPGLYKLVFKSHAPNAEKFTDWVADEVLPAIRKHGAYMTDAKIEEVLTDPDTIIKLAQQLKTERQGRLIAEQRVNELQPKANYLDKILANKSLVTITQIAKDYGMSGQEMNALLHSLKVQYRQSGTWLLYSKYQRTGWTQSYSKPITHKDGTPGMVMTTKWTQKGRLGLYELLKDHDVLPLIEQDVEA